MTAGDWNRTVDEGTEQERNISTIIAVVYQMVINSLYEGIWKVLNMVFVSQ